MSRSARASRSKCSCRAASVPNVGPACTAVASHHGLARHVRLCARRPRARAVGRVRGVSVPRGRLDAVSRPGLARSRHRVVVQSARRGHSLGGHRAGDQTGRRGGRARAGRARHLRRGGGQERGRELRHDHRARRTRRASLWPSHPRFRCRSRGRRRSRRSRRGVASGDRRACRRRGRRHRQGPCCPRAGRAARTNAAARS